MTRPDILYHYTDGVGLQGILESRVLRAGHIAYLNDSQEYKYALDVAAQIVGARPSRRVGNHRWLAECQSSYPEFVEQLQMRVSERLVGRTPNVFAASLTTQGDDLSQWRGYCRFGDGYAIGFDRARLKVAASQQGWRLEPVKYGTDAVAIVYKLIGEAISNRRQLGTTESADSLAADSLFEKLISMAPFVKDGGFSGEREWRISREVGTGIRPRFRAGSRSLVPYLEFSYGDTREDSAAIHVCCGPGPDMSAAVAALAWYASPLLNVRSHGVSPSSATYRQ